MMCVFVGTMQGKNAIELAEECGYSHLIDLMLTYMGTVNTTTNPSKVGTMHYMVCM